MAERRAESAATPAAGPEPRSKSGLGLLRRLSFRWRRAGACIESTATDWPSPPSPSSTATIAGASRSASTSTSSLDADACRQSDGSADQQPPPLLPRSEDAPPPRTKQPDDDGDAPASTSASDELELHRVLLSRLECPVCYLPMAPPIRQCVYGHSVCAGCEARLARCPTCRGAFLAATNATLNAIALAVRLPCRYRACRALLRLADKARHEERCRHREYPCPHTRCRRAPWTVRYSGGPSRTGMDPRTLEIQVYEYRTLVGVRGFIRTLGHSNV
ncbi:E3 ubiquitin-protein ligase Siah1 [Frankliniella fusca]|uniref:E3 ubiquitin-protein ligase Siah1 n=1 Tax=Frankliniella fusca TaxID=407009 RepID=A0AAE1L7H4_9NEOP|nr:E3 ubiquitin-protein ligase Siah1 [Frankliniella fusca]